MAKTRESEESKILHYFRTASLDRAELVFDLVKGEMKSRSINETAKTPGPKAAKANGQSHAGGSAKRAKGQGKGKTTPPNDPRQEEIGQDKYEHVS